MISLRSRRVAQRVPAVLLVALGLTAAGAAAAEPVGELTVDGKTIALVHAEASATTMGGDDPVTFVRLTEKATAAGSEGNMAAMGGEAGAVFAIHLHASGAVEQVLALHPAADPSFPVDIPMESVRVSGLSLADGKLAATVESDGDIRVDGHVWSFRFDLRLPIRPLD